ncbi:MAG: ribonuclease R, partial [Devosiaceae bacterium]|nr:ribonuclease R [Devosiaceae bacterium MH13]
MSRLPSDDEVLAFLADNPGQNGKREVARAFGIKGSDRIALKQQLKSLRDRGLLSKEGSSLRPADALPAVFPAHIVSVDDDGEPLIEPNLPFDGSPPRFVLVQKSSKRARTATRPPGIGDMVLVRQTEPPENGAAGAAELIKVIGKPVGRTFGVLRLPSRGPATVEPVDRKADVLTVPVHELGEAKDGDLVAATRLPGRRRNPEARVD